MLHTLILILLIALVFYYDGRYQRIPNLITLPIIGMGLIINTIISGLPGLTASCLGLITGMALLLIPFLLGGIGAGDVKLLAAIGSIAGLHFVIAAFLYGAIIGGVWSVILLVKQRSRVFPYGLAIGSGVIAVWFLGIPF